MNTQLNPTHDSARRSWVESANQAGCDFPIQNLPLGIFRVGEGGEKKAGVAIGDAIVDLQALLQAKLLSGAAATAAQATEGGRLNGLMALGNGYASALRAQLSDLLRADSPGLLRVQALQRRIVVPMSDVVMELPCEIGDYSDFLTSVHHTERLGRYKGLKDPLPAACKSLPVAYHGRASSIRASGAGVRRPHGQYKNAQGEVVFGPATLLDYELEMAAWVGRGNTLGQPIAINDAQDYLFGYSLLNDWSAKSIQWWEQVLGPFLGKSFMSSISPWVVTSEALAPFRLPAPPRAAGDPALLPYLNGATDQTQGGLDIALEAWISTPEQRSAQQPPVRITQTHLHNLYWTFGQMLTHHASNGCNLRPGDLMGSGTVSGLADESRACMTELTQAGAQPLDLGDGQWRAALQDGDEIILKARASHASAVPIGFGECRGRITPALQLHAW